MSSIAAGTHHFDTLVIGAGVLLLASVFASKAAGRLGVPALLLFVALGMLAGSEGVGGFYFDDFHLTHNLGVVALIFILFAGGLDTHWKSIRPVLGAGISLATLGVVITGGMIALFAHYVLLLSWGLSILLGSIVSSTDAAAVFGILRARGLKLKGNLVPLLELESGSNDPMAVFLTLSITTLLVTPAANVWSLVPDLFVQMIFGVLGGWLIGLLAFRCLNSMRLSFDGLYPVFTVGVALIAYAGPQFIGGNGYLSVYVAGVTLGSRNFLHRVSLINFHDALGWLMQIGMFLCLGLLVFPSELLPEAVVCIGVALFLMFVARPLAVLISLAPFKFSLNEKLFLSWVGLRGAVPIILATIPVTFGVAGSEKIFNEVFFIVLASVLIQSMSVERVARYLGVISLEPEFVKHRKVVTSMLEVTVAPNSSLVGKRVFELGLPEGVLLILLTRGEEAKIPSGATVLEAGDLLLVSHQGIPEQEVHKMLQVGE